MLVLACAWLNIQPKFFSSQSMKPWLKVLVLGRVLSASGSPLNTRWPNALCR